jgi:hypothetical protein
MAMVRFLLMMLAAALAAPVIAQESSGQPLSRAVIERSRLEKKAWVALNMDLKQGEEERFWPLYEGYQKELTEINLRLIRLVESYAVHYRNHTLTDDIARKLTEESLALDESELKLRRNYFNRLAKVLPASKAARYLQLESKVHTQVRYELAANLPLVGDVRPDIPRAEKGTRDASPQPTPR